MVDILFAHRPPLLFWWALLKVALLRRVPVKYEWSDDAAATLRSQVWALVRDRDDDVHDTDRRQADDGTIVRQLYGLAATFRDRPVTTAEKIRLKTLFRGGPSRRQAKASAITLELLAWKAGGGERDVTNYKKALKAGTRPALDFLRYR